MSRFNLNKNDRIVILWCAVVAVCVAGLFLFSDGEADGEAYEDGDSLLYERNYYGKGYKKRRYLSQYEKDSAFSHGRYRGERSDTDWVAVDAARQRRMLHPFDLNYASAEELYSLGFTERQVQSVMKYRGKGGVYRRVEQLSRIAGMTKGDYDRLAPYFRLSEKSRPARDFVKVPEPEPFERDDRNAVYQRGAAVTVIDTARIAQLKRLSALEHQNKLKPGETVPINSSDTTALKRVPGIGSVYASMIVKYRERLGGFYSLRQLDDLEALPSNLHEFLSLDEVELRKVNVNKLSINQLVNHPYINYRQARAIKEYIRIYGSLTSIKQLRLHSSFTEKDIERLEHYLVY